MAEVSLVTFPANEHARVSSVKRFYGGEVLPSEREFEAFLHEAGFSRKQSKVVVAKGFRALTAENGRAAEALRALCASLRTAAEENRGATGYKSASPVTAAGLLHSLRRATLENIGAKYRSDQARSPRGNSDGGQWVDEGRGGAGGGSGRAPRSSSGGGRFGAGKLPKDPWLHEANSRNKPGHPRRPMDDMLEGGGGGRGGGGGFSGGWRGRSVAKPSPAQREPEYLREARKLPEGVRETGKGVNKLTPQQAQKLEKWKKNNNNYKNQHGAEVDVITYSDGRAIYTFKVPGNVPGSYRVNEKHVSPSGETIKTYGINIDPEGNLIHIKPKGINKSKKSMIDSTMISNGHIHMKTRKEFLEELLAFKVPDRFESLQEGLAAYGWDSDETLVTLSEAMVISILERYLSGELSEKQVEDWAWAIEDREDVAIGDEEGDNKELFFALAELANPETEGGLTHEGAQKLIAQLESV